MVRGLDGIFLWYPVWRCAVLKGLREGVVSQDSGGHGEGETPLPIPNRAVKPLSADGTWLARAWESRTPPVFPSEYVMSVSPLRRRRRRCSRSSRSGPLSTVGPARLGRARSARSGPLGTVGP